MASQRICHRRSPPLRPRRRTSLRILRTRTCQSSQPQSMQYLSRLFMKGTNRKLQDMALLLARYRGREREPYHEVCFLASISLAELRKLRKKYGTHPAEWSWQDHRFHARQLKERQAEAVGGGD
mmetsp:Transcript_25908/g.60359  ORF Transcript_25908/g.60359 Transcript_25908/m.60359 type:complete len:124 (-) Transcript_25908:159-530(-)